MRKTSRLFGAAVCLAFLEMQEKERKREVGRGGSQGRNLHSEAQIDAKQLLNSCKVEQLLGRRGKRNGGDEGMKDQERETGRQRETERPRGRVEIFDYLKRAVD